MRQLQASTKRCRSREMNTRRVLIALLVLLPVQTAVAQVIERAAGSFDRAHVITQGGEQRVRQANNLSGTVGRYDYEVAIERDGWYELSVAGYAAESEVFIFPAGAEKPTAYVPGSLGHNGKDDKVGNFWLTRGRHVVRLQRYFWTGFPDIRGFTLNASDGALATSLRVVRPVKIGRAHV